MAAVVVTQTENRKVTEQGIAAEDLIPCMACCCVHDSFYCKFPECIGFDMKGICICCEERAACKCKVPTTCCKGQAQFFCCDERCAFPCDDEVPFWIGCCGITCCGGPKKAGTTTEVSVTGSNAPMDVSVTTAENRQVRENGIPAEDLIPCLMCCCCHYSLYCKFPACCGFDCTEECICCREQASCKCISPTTCCLCQRQCCCCDERCALPCNDEVPFWIACCGITCAGGPTKKGTTTEVVMSPTSQQAPGQATEQQQPMPPPEGIEQPVPPPGASYMKNGLWMDENGNPVSEKA